MSKVIIYDFEIFAYDTLLGANVIDENGNSKIYQSWDIDEIKNFYSNHTKDLWVGHNNYSYDDRILDSVMHNENTFDISCKITHNDYNVKRRIRLFSIDLMKLTAESYSLKLTELLRGKNIHTTDVPFDLPRKLTDEERALTEQYNRSDLYQTTYNYNIMYDLIRLRFDIIKEFNLDLEKNIELSGSALSVNVLKPKNMPALKYSSVTPVLYNQLKLENQRVKQYYLNKEYKNNDNLTIKIGNLDLSLGKGGIHGAEKKIYSDKVIYVDVKGYYNLIALKYNLLPRNLNDEAKQKYKSMYETQLRLKVTNPTKREAYKVILLGVIGSMYKETSPFYDPENYLLLTATGQLFIVDLLEKLEGLTKTIQVNTDGIMIEPYDWNNEDKIVSIIREWETRTGFDIKIDYLYRLFQRDVNCYCCLDKNDKIIFKGDSLKNFDIGEKAYASQSIFKCKEPPIIAQGIINFLIYGTEPEEYVKSVKKELKLFQYACNKTGFDYMTYDTINVVNMEHSTEKIQSVSRAFAFKSKIISGMIYKHKDKKGKHHQNKYPSLPDNVFIYNGDLNEVSDDFYDNIDYQYYIDRIYEKIGDFIDF